MAQLSVSFETDKIDSENLRNNKFANLTEGKVHGYSFICVLYDINVIIPSVNYKCRIP